MKLQEPSTVLSTSWTNLWPFWNQRFRFKAEKLPTSQASGSDMMQARFREMVKISKDTLPETNSEFTAEIEWLEYDRFRLGWPIFRGYVSFRECICQSDPVIQILVSEIRQPFAEVLGTRGPIHNATDQNRLNRFCESYRL